MPKAIITLEDVTVDGQAQMTMSLFLEGGFQPESHAHQHAGLVLKHLDSIAGMKTDEAVKWVDGAFVPSGEMAVPTDPGAGRLQLDGPDGLRLIPNGA